jgi:hypothetical protein
MQFMLLLYEDQADFERRNGPEGRPFMSAYKLYGDALRAGKAMAGGAALQPPHSATTVRVRNGERRVQDGPFADTKEQLGGYYIVEAPDLDAALDWAAKCPAASYGTVEVRPVWFVGATT